MKKSKILTITILSLIIFWLSSTVSKAQNLPTDTIPKFNITELKLISGFLYELEYRRLQSSLLLKEVSYYDTLLKEKNAEINLIKEKNNLLAEKIIFYEDYIQNNQKKFYDNFLFGFSSATVLTIVLFLITK